MSERQRGQIAVAAVGLTLLVIAGAGVLIQLSGILTAGAHAQTGADLAALAAARTLADDPAASPARLQQAAAAAARANGARLVRLRLGMDGALPAAVEAVVRTGAGDGRSVQLRSRAGVSFAAVLPAGSFRPVALAGLGRREAVVAAAEAQIGWPYVWGGESRAEGGFDCSGLIDYAFSAAGRPLPGRPTAADLYRLSTPIAENELTAGDLVFMGAPSGRPYHVGMYVGAGTVVAAPHTGAVVSYQSLAGGGWDGFGRLLPSGPAPPPTAVELAARRFQVPANVLAAALLLRLVPSAETGARTLAAAQDRHPGDLAAALADALGSGSRAALVLRAAAGPGLGDGFSASVRLLPVGSPPSVGSGLEAELRWRLPSARAPARPVAGGSLAGSIAGAAGSGSGATDLAGRVAEGAAGRLPGLPRLAALARPLGRGALSLVALVAPDRRLADAASFAGAVWDGIAAVAAIASRAEPAAGIAGRLVGGLGIAGGALTAVAGAIGLARARTRRGRLRAGATMTSGLLVAGGGMLAMGVLVTAVPPVGLGLIAVGTAIYAGTIVYDHWDGIAAAGRTLRRRLAVLPARAAGAASAVADAVASLSPF